MKGSPAGHTARAFVGSLVGSGLLECSGSICPVVLQQKGLDPVVVAPLADAIGDRGGVGRHLEALAEGLAEPLQHRSGQRADGGRIEGRQAGVEGWRLGCRSWQLCGWLSFSMSPRHGPGVRFFGAWL
jgi:hypothetical protein